MGIMADVGVLDSPKGKITPEAREKFVDDVNLLLLNGFDGKLFGLVDIAGDVPDLVFEGSNLLSDPFTLKPIEDHEAKFPTFHKFFIDTLFEKVAVALDVEGATPLAPIMDPTFIFPNFDLAIPFPELLVKLVTGFPPPPELVALGIPFDMTIFDVEIDDLDIPAIVAAIPIPAPPIPPVPIPDLPGIPDLIPAFTVPPIPSIPFPELPAIPPLHLPNLVLYNIIDIVLCIVLAIIEAIVKMVTIKALDMVTALSEKAVIGLIAFVAAELLLNIIACLTGLQLKNALSFVAAFVVFLERVIGMVCTDVVGLVLGSPGLIVQGVAQFVNLV